MSKLIRIISVLLILSPSYSNATSPCVSLSKSEFIDGVLKPSDLVVFAEISDYSSSLEHKLNREWTDIKIIETIATKNLEDKVSKLTIKDWQAVFYPLYDYPKGTQVILLLKKEGTKYIFTNNNWRQCTPSTINVKGDMIYDEFGLIKERENVSTAAFKAALVKNYK